MSTTKATEAEQAERDHVLDNPPEGFDGPEWRFRLLGGYADKLAGLVETERPLVEKYRQLGKLAVLQGNDLGAADYRRRLADLEPKVLINEKLLAAAGPWVGHHPKALDAALRDAEAALVAAQGAQVDHGGASKLVLDTAPDAEARTALESALAPGARSLAAKVGNANAVVTAARKDRDDRTAALADAKAALERSARSRLEALK